MQNIKIPFDGHDQLQRYEPHRRGSDAFTWKDNFEITDFFEVDSEDYELGSRSATIWIVGSVPHGTCHGGDRYTLTLREFMKIVPYIKSGHWNGTICYAKHGSQYFCKVVKNG